MKKSILNLKIGDSFKIKDIQTESIIKKRLEALGIIKNSTGSIYNKSPFGDPIILSINNSNIAIRKSILKNILIY